MPISAAALIRRAIENSYRRRRNNRRRQATHLRSQLMSAAAAVANNSPSPIRAPSDSIRAPDADYVDQLIPDEVGDEDDDEENNRRAAAVLGPIPGVDDVGEDDDVRIIQRPERRLSYAHTSPSYSPSSPVFNASEPSASESSQLNAAIAESMGLGVFSAAPAVAPAAPAAAAASGVSAADAVLNRVDPDPLVLDFSRIVDSPYNQDEVQCGICLSVMTKKIGYIEGCAGVSIFRPHRLCMDCANRIRPHNWDSFDIKKCPTCAVAGKVVEDRSGVVSDRLEKCSVQCAFGCGATYKLNRNLKGEVDHRAVCPLNFITCGECNEKMPANTLEAHRLESCFKKCTECESKVLVSAMDLHLTTECSHRMVPCPDDCGTSVMFSKMHIHKKGVVEGKCFGFIACPLGCTEEHSDERPAKRTRREGEESAAAADSSVKIIKLSELMQHKSVCPNRTIKCPICSEEIMASAQKQHNKYRMTSHMIITSERFLQMQSMMNTNAPAAANVGPGTFHTPSVSNMTRQYCVVLPLDRVNKTRNASAISHSSRRCTQIAMNQVSSAKVTFHSKGIIRSNVVDPDTIKLVIGVESDMSNRPIFGLRSTVMKWGIQVSLCKKAQENDYRADVSDEFNTTRRHPSFLSYTSTFSLPSIFINDKRSFETISYSSLPQDVLADSANWAICIELFKQE